MKKYIFLFCILLCPLFTDARTITIKSQHPYETTINFYPANSIPTADAHYEVKKIPAKSEDSWQVPDTAFSLKYFTRLYPRGLTSSINKGTDNICFEITPSGATRKCNAPKSYLPPATHERPDVHGEHK